MPGANVTRCGAASSARYVGIDVLKACAILVVVWIHVFLRLERPPVGTWRVLTSLARFAVPAFFFASGFLSFQRVPISAQLLRRRVARIVVPYVVASLIAIAGRSVRFGWIGVEEVGFELLTGDAVGIYYFVPALLTVVPVLMWISWYPSFTGVCAFGFWWLGLFSELGLINLGGRGFEPFFWNFRNPLRWWGYCIVGWLAAKEIGRFADLTPAARWRLALATLGVVAALLAFSVVALPPTRTPAWAVLEYVRIYGCIFGIFLLAFDWREPAAIRWLSEATYPIYLYHFFFISLFRVFVANLLQRRLMLPLAADAVTYVVALAGSLMVIWIGRRLFGRHARLVIG